MALVYFLLKMMLFPLMLAVPSGTGTNKNASNAPLIGTLMQTELAFLCLPSVRPMKVLAVSVLLALRAMTWFREFAIYLYLIRSHLMLVVLSGIGINRSVRDALLTGTL